MHTFVCVRTKQLLSWITKCALLELRKRYIANVQCCAAPGWWWNSLKWNSSRDIHTHTHTGIEKKKCFSFKRRHGIDIKNLVIFFIASTSTSTSTFPSFSSSVSSAFSYFSSSEMKNNYILHFAEPKNSLIRRCRMCLCVWCTIYALYDTHTNGNHNNKSYLFVELMRSSPKIYARASSHTAVSYSYLLSWTQCILVAATARYNSFHILQTNVRMWMCRRNKKKKKKIQNK